MKRSDFFKKAIGLIGIASNPAALSALAEPIAEVLEMTPYVPGATLGFVNKSYVSAIDPILDTREINRMIESRYSEDDLKDILLNASKYNPREQG